MSQTFDVIIVGAGPAGSIAAKHLAAGKLNVLLLDKSKFPRNKPCGGGLIGHIFKEFPEVIKHTTNMNRMVQIYSGKIPYPLKYKKELIGCHCIRYDFDHHLVKDAVNEGAKFQDNEEVIDLEISSDGVLVKTKKDQYRCQVVLGADGVFSQVAKKSNLNLNWPRSALGMTVRAEVKVPEDEILKYIGNDYPTTFHGDFDGTPGIGYIFPKKDRINIGYGTLTKDKVDFRSGTLKFIDYCEKSGRIPKLSNYELAGGFYPISGPLKKFVSDRVILLGDAAGFVNALGGEGIFYAMLSGRIASEVIVDAFKKQNFSNDFLMEYQKKCNKRFGTYLKRAAGLQIFGLKNQKLFVKFGRYSPKIARGFSDMFKEELNPWIVSLKMGFILLWEMIKYPFRSKKEKNTEIIHEIETFSNLT